MSIEHTIEPTVPSGSSGCTCPGRADGKHGLLCEDVLRGAFGSVADAPEEVKQMLRNRGRLTDGEVVVTVSSPEVPEIDPRVREVHDKMMEEFGPPPVLWTSGRTPAGEPSIRHEPASSWMQARDELRLVLDEQEDEIAESMSPADTPAELTGKANHAAELMELWFQLKTWPDNQPFSMTVRGTEYWIRLASEVAS